MENLSRHVASVHTGFTKKMIPNSNIASVREGIKPVKCRVCDHIFSKYSSRKEFHCNICDHNTNLKSDMNRLISSVHEGKKEQELSYKI